MKEKPNQMIYVVEDRPPNAALLMLGLQHVLSMASFLVLPVILAREMHFTDQETVGLVQLSMFGCGLTSILLSMSRSAFGSGSLLTAVCANAYFVVAMLAAQKGGLPLVMGMTLIAALIQVIFAFCIPFLRSFFPPEVTGLVATMVGISFINTVTKNITGSTGAGTVFQALPVIIGLGTLVAIIAFSIWGRGQIKLFSVLGGACVGLALSWFLSYLPASTFQQVADVQLVGLNFIPHGGLAFDPQLFLAFGIASLASGIKAIGDLTAAQKIADPDWKRPDIEKISRGVIANAIGVFISGLVGGFPPTASASSIGMALATGAVARRIGIAAGFLMLVMAFLPKVAVVFVLLPRPVVGGMLAFVACFNIVTGINIMLSRMMDMRSMFVIGLAMVAGLSVELTPQIYRGIPVIFSSLFTSSMALAAIIAIALHAVFRFGIRQTQQLTVSPHEQSALTINRELQKFGEAWGARPEFIARLANTLCRLVLLLAEEKITSKDVRVSVSFDELNLDADVYYEGAALPLPDPPIAPEMERIALRLDEVRRGCDRMQISRSSSQEKVHIHFQQ